MTRQTILQMMGAARTPELSSSTLIVIDAQKIYDGGKLALDGMSAAMDAGRKVLAAARKAGTPIVHIQHHTPAGSPIFAPEDPQTAFIAGFEPAAGEGVVTKTRANSFFDTDLDARLKAIGRKDVIILGFMTHNCVDATTRAAKDLGYEPFVIGDATASRTLPSPNGGKDVSGETIAVGVLAGLSDTYAGIISSQAVAV